MVKSKSLEAVRERERERELQFSKISGKVEGDIAFVCDRNKDRVYTK